MVEMIQNGLAALPGDGSFIALFCAMTGTLIGFGMWLAGARYSRSIVTLTMVAVGSSVGMRVPGWMGWNLDPYAGGVGGALLLGLSGYTMHRWWVGVGLGIVLALWAALATWHFGKGAAEINWPVFDAAKMTTADYLVAVWKALPEDITRIAPFICGTALLSGLVAALMWPRVGVIMLYVMLGLSLLLSMGWVALQIGNPRAIEMMPSRESVVIVMLAGLVLVGALAQWKFAPDAGRKAEAPTRAE